MLREQALARFTAFQNAAASGIYLRRLTNEEMFRDLLMCVTYHDYPALLPTPNVRLNEVIGCERFIGGMAPFINGFHLRPVCITAYPAYTVPQILAVLLRHPGRMLISARFICHDAYDAQQLLKLERQHWHREILGSVWKVVKGWFGKDHKIDQDSQAMLADIDAAIAASAAGATFGNATITAVVRDSNPDRAELRAQELRKDCHALGITARLEDVNAAEAIRGTHPGNGESNVRKPIITGANFADVTLPVEHWQGMPYIDNELFPENTPVPLICSGTGREPFWYPTHINGVGNQLIIGPVGTGKSSLLGTLVAAYTGVPDSRIVCLDVDYSSFVLTHLMEGEYRDLGSPETPPLNPMAFLDLPGGKPFLYGWFERLFKRWKEFELSERAFGDFGEALRKAKAEGVRDLVGLRALIHSDGPGEREKIRRILQQYIKAWGHIFNDEGAVPNAPLPPLTVFEMRGLMSYDERVSAPATELVLQYVISRLDGISPCWVFIDEAWAFISDKSSAEWFFDALRAGRKRKVSYVLATQSLTEIVNHPYRALLLESCPGKVFCPNPEARGAYVARMYLELGLNEHEVAIIGSASPRREYLFRSSVGTRLFTLALGDVAKAVCASTGYKDVQLARRVLKESPDGLFLDAWLGERLGPDWQRRLPVTPETSPLEGR